MADLSPLLGEERKSDFGAVRSVDDPLRMLNSLNVQTCISSVINLSVRYICGAVAAKGYLRCSIR